MPGTPRSAARPRVVKLFVTLEVVSLILYVAVEVNRHNSVSIGSAIWSLANTAFLVWQVWRRSRVGWCIVLALTVPFLPFVYTFVRAGTLGVALFSVEFATALVVASPWMIRWVWKAPRMPTTTPVEQPPTP